jgi:ankyrin repeat protein
MPLSWAAEKGHERVIRTLLEFKADVNYIDFECGKTALSWAVEGGHEKVI